jgi:hypothetical protein
MEAPYAQIGVGRMHIIKTTAALGLTGLQFRLSSSACAGGQWRRRGVPEARMRLALAVDQ